MVLWALSLDSCLSEGLSNNRLTKCLYEGSCSSLSRIDCFKSFYESRFPGIGAAPQSPAFIKWITNIPQYSSYWSSVSRNFCCFLFVLDFEVQPPVIKADCPQDCSYDFYHAWIICSSGPWGLCHGLLFITETTNLPWCNYILSKKLQNLTSSNTRSQEISVFIILLVSSNFT